MNRYLAINIEGKIGHPTVIRTSSFNKCLSKQDVQVETTIDMFELYHRLLTIFININSIRSMGELVSKGRMEVITKKKMSIG